MTKDELQQQILSSCENIDWIEVYGTNHDYTRDAQSPLGEHLVKLHNPIEEKILDNFGNIHFIALGLAKSEGSKYYKYTLKKGGVLELSFDGPCNI
jgi:hypothetical protein